jgi:adenylate kinase
MIDQTLDNVLFFPFIAPPNGGKGTQTSVLSDLFQMPRIDMGSMLREIAKEDSSLGREVNERLINGLLVDTPIVMDVMQDGVMKALQQHPNAQGRVGFILDGFPRNLEQTQGLMGLCERTGASVAKAIYLDVPNEKIIERAVNRRICPVCGTIYNLAFKPPKQDGLCDLEGATLEQRADDRPEKVERRLIAFADETLPILQEFEQRGLLVRVNGDRPVKEVTEQLSQLMQGYLSPANAL